MKAYRQTRGMIAKTVIAAMAVLVMAGGAYGQSSSLVLEDASRPQLDRLPRMERPIAAQQPFAQQPESRLAPAIARTSLMAVQRPEPRTFQRHDLVTIIIRESVQNESRSRLSTEKESSIDGKIDAFPRFNLTDLLEFQLGQSRMSRGTPEVSITLENEFDGRGDTRRQDSFTARVQAEIIDVKPNGNLVLEARRYIQTDDETLTMTMTGTARSEDITADNTVLSTSIADLRLIKHHTGELRRTTRKGLITKIFETIFNF